MLVLSVVPMIARLYLDDRMHPGMDTALEEVHAFAEPLYLYAVTGADNRSDILGALGKSRQP